jgi:hypothetical protein
MTKANNSHKLPSFTLTKAAVSAADPQTELARAWMRLLPTVKLPNNPLPNPNNPNQVRELLLLAGRPATAVSGLVAGLKARLEAFAR